jgi:hypothetical protein
MKLQTYDYQWVTTDDIEQARAIQRGYIPLFEGFLEKFNGPLKSALQYKETAREAIDQFNLNAAEISLAMEQAEIDALRVAISNFLAAFPAGE